MQIVRTIIWVLILVGLLLFSYFNWTEVEVTIWENLLVETKVPALVIVSFLLGLVPMWMYHRGVRWSLSRKIVSLESAARTQAAPPPTTETTPPDAGTSPAPPPQTESEALKPEAEKP